MFPGTFDPPTNGHADIMMRAVRMFEHLDVVISVNPQKSTIFSPEERVEMIQSIVGGMQNVSVHTWEGLIVDFAAKMQTRIILRGVRALTDFNYEFELSMMNRALSQNIETVFLPTDQKYFVLRSSTIKEIARYHGDISKMVPSVVAAYLKSKFENLDISAQTE